MEVAEHKVASYCYIGIIEDNSGNLGMLVCIGRVLVFLQY